MGDAKDLEKLWRQNRGRLQRTFHSYRPKGVRGPALVKWLMLLGGIWQDRRFDDCINALLEHGIVKPYSHEFIDPQDADELARCVAEVRARVAHGESRRQACLEVAAKYGLRGNSLESAAQRLRERVVG
jgi:hypothetical protein